MSLGLQGWLLKPGMGFVARGYKARFVHVDLWGGEGQGEGGEGAGPTLHFSKDESGAPPNGALALKARRRAAPPRRRRDAPRRRAAPRAAPALARARALALSCPARARGGSLPLKRPVEARRDQILTDSRGRAAAVSAARRGGRRARAS